MQAGRRLKDYDAVERHVREQLAAVGVQIDRLVDLVNLGPTPRAAVPVLVDALIAADNDLAREMLVRALSDRVARPTAVPALLEEFRTANTEAYRWTVGNALHTVADRRFEADLIALATDPRYGYGRQMLAAKLGYMRSPAALDALLALLTVDEVDGHAVVGLNRMTPELLRDRRVRSAVEPFLTDQRAWVRKAAKSVVGKAVSDG